MHETFKPRSGADEKPYTAIHAALFRRPFRGYVTTNYDIALSEAQSALRPGDHPLPIIWRGDDMSRVEREPVTESGAREVTTPDHAAVVALSVQELEAAGVAYRDVLKDRHHIRVLFYLLSNKQQRRVLFYLPSIKQQRRANRQVYRARKYYLSKSSP